MLLWTTLIFEYHNFKIIKNVEHGRLTWAMQKKRTMKKNIADLNRTCDETIYFLFQTTYYLGNEVIPFHKFPDLCYLFVKVKANMTEYFYHHEKNCNEILFCIS